MDAGRLPWGSWATISLVDLKQDPFLASPRCLKHPPPMALFFVELIASKSGPPAPCGSNVLLPGNEGCPKSVFGCIPDEAFGESLLPQIPIPGGESGGLAWPLVSIGLLRHGDAIKGLAGNFLTVGRSDVCQGHGLEEHSTGIKLL